ncbi:MAG TPA: glycosyltransferase family 39 protein, partial [bacterium]|nr:glycosyltransferase family 39 protein [bacterium]
MKNLAPTGSLGIWAVFSTLVLANGALAYLPLSLQAKLWIFLAGILLPMGLYGQGKIPTGIAWAPQKPKDLFPVPPLWVWLSLLGLGLFLRFFMLTDFRSWPTGDEGLQGFFAIELVKKWDWRFFYTSGQHPPLFIWILKIFFQLFSDPFFNLWFPPAVLSFLALLGGCLVSRVFFSKPVAFVLGLLLAFSFWPLEFGRFCVQGSLVPVCELLCLYLFGRFLGASTPESRRMWGVVLGLSLGLGSLTFTSWATVVLFVVSLVWVEAFSQSPKDFRSLALFGVSFLIGVSPWLMAALLEGYGGYLVGVSTLSGFFTWKQQFLTSISNLTVLLW